MGGITERELGVRDGSKALSEWYPGCVLIECGLDDRMASSSPRAGNVNFIF